MIASAVGFPRDWISEGGGSKEIILTDVFNRKTKSVLIDEMIHILGESRYAKKVLLKATKPFS